MNAAAPALRQQRCLNHPQREASARCPECGRFYCRECITEHEDRVVCASCLAKLSLKKSAGQARWALLPRLGLAVVAFAIVFLLWFMLGNFLLSFPSQYHDVGGW